MKSGTSDKTDIMGKEGKEMADSARSGYAGKIKNTGTQIVDAVYKTGKTSGKSTVKKGNDLRSGR